MQASGSREDKPQKTQFSKLIFQQVCHPGVNMTTVTKRSNTIRAWKKSDKNRRKSIGTVLPGSDSHRCKYLRARCILVW